MKTIKSLAYVVLALALTISCSSSDNSTPSCDDLAATTDAAEQAYIGSTASNHNQLCNAYKTALQNEIAACGDPDGSLQAAVTDLGDCTLPQNTGGISVTTGTQSKTFGTNISVTVLGSTRKIKAYNASQLSEFIEFELQQSVTGLNKVSNFVIHLGTKDYTPLPEIDGGTWTSNITLNNATTINGTFSGYVTSADNATIGLTSGMIGVTIN